MACGIRPSAGELAMRGNGRECLALREKSPTPEGGRRIPRAYAHAGCRAADGRWFAQNVHPRNASPLRADGPGMVRVSCLAPFGHALLRRMCPRKQMRPPLPVAPVDTVEYNMLRRVLTCSACSDGRVTTSGSPKVGGTSSKMPPAGIAPWRVSARMPPYTHRSVQRTRSASAGRTHRQTWSPQAMG